MGWWPGPNGLERARKARRCPLHLTPNAFWCTDYKGEFRLGNQRYCYPLTVIDRASRYLLSGYFYE